MSNAYVVRFLRVLSFLLVVYLFGRVGLHWSILVPLILGWIVLEKRQMRFQQKIQSFLFVQDRKKLASLPELPSWVSFPEVEPLDWLNVVLKKMWPYINQTAVEQIRTSTHPIIQNNLPTLLSSLEFTELDMGNKPPLFTGMKAYERKNKEDMLFDCHFVWDGEFVALMKAKVALSSFDLGLTDLRIAGSVRILAKPLVTRPPFIGALSISLVNRPDIDFTLKGIANIMEVPGLHGVLRNFLTNTIVNMLVFPERIIVPLVDLPPATIDALQNPEPTGFLLVNLVSGRALKVADAMSAMLRSAPLCTLQVGNQSYQATAPKRTADPTWDLTFEFVVHDANVQKLKLEVIDKDQFDIDQSLGSCEIPLKSSEDGTWITHLETLNRVSTGQLVVKTMYKPLEKSMEESAGLPLPEERFSCALLRVALFKLTGLVSAQPADIYCELNVSNTSQQTSVASYTNEPEWGKHFDFRVKDVSKEKLTVKVFAKQPLKLLKNVLLGVVEVPLDELIYRTPKTLWPLEGAAAGQPLLHMHVKLKVLRDIKRLSSFKRDLPVDSSLSSDGLFTPFPR